MSKGQRSQTNKGLRLPIECHRETSGSVLPLDPEQNCSKPNADSNSKVDIFGDFSEINSIGMSYTQLYVARI